MLPGERNGVSAAANTQSTNASEGTDTFNVFHTDNTDADTGTLFYRTLDKSGRTIANPGLTLTGFEMGDDIAVEQGTASAPQPVYYGGGITLIALKSLKSCWARAMRL